MTNSLRIALYHNMGSGGALRAAYEFGRGLTKSGHHVDLYWIPPPVHAQARSEEFVEHFAEQVFRFDYDRPSSPPIPVPYLPLARDLRLLRRLNRLSEKIAMEIDRRGYDVAFIHNGEYIAPPYVLRYLQTRSVYFCPEPMRELYESLISRDYAAKPPSLRRSLWRTHTASAKAIYRSLLRVQAQKNARAADSIVTLSYYAREAIFRAWSISAKVVYLGVDSEKFRPLNVPEENVVLSIGNIQPRKQHDFVIEAVARIDPPLRPEVVIIGLGGGDSESQYLKDLASKRKVKLTILQYISEQEIVEWYNRAKVVACAQILESFGFIVLESMACGTPVVAVKEAGFRETVVDGETGFLVDRSVEEFAVALRELLANDKLRQEFGMRAREYVCSRWGWDDSIQVLVDHFDSVISTCSKG